MEGKWIICDRNARFKIRRNEKDDNHVHQLLQSTLLGIHTKVICKNSQNCLQKPSGFFQLSSGTIPKGQKVNLVGKNPFSEVGMK